MKHFQDRVAVVTGAAGGIGRAVSVALAREGCHLAISDVNEEALEQTAELIRAEGRRVCTHRVDVGDKQRLEAYAQEVMGEYGQVNILINNAGVAVGAKFEGHSMEDFEWIVNINLWGTIYGCHYFLPHLKAADEAHIVNLSSVFGIVGIPVQSSYCTTKFGVRGFTESLWTEMQNTNVGVTAVYPGGVKTDIARSARVADAETRAKGEAMIENARTTPEHCAQLIVKAIKKKMMRLLVGSDAHILDWLKRAMPTATQKLFRIRPERGL